MSAPKVKIRRCALGGAERRSAWPPSMLRMFASHLERGLVDGSRSPPRATPHRCRCQEMAVRELETRGQALALLEDALADLELAAGFLFKTGVLLEHRRLMRWMARFANVGQRAATSLEGPGLAADQKRIAEALAALVVPLERAQKRRLGPHAPYMGWSAVHPSRKLSPLRSR